MHLLLFSVHGYTQIVVTMVQTFKYHSAGLLDWISGTINQPGIINRSRSTGQYYLIQNENRLVSRFSVADQFQSNDG